MAMNEKLLTTAQAAERLGVTARTVINLIRHKDENGESYLKAIRPAWAYFVTERTLADYLQRKAEGKIPSVGRPRKEAAIAAAKEEA